MNHEIKKNILLCNNSAELLTWKHALCEELRNGSLSLEITWIERKTES